MENQSNIVIVKWFDTKAVTVASTFAGVDPVAQARRWAKTRKERVHIPRPHALTLYNDKMGGVDLIDMLCGKARSPSDPSDGTHTYFGTPSNLPLPMLGWHTAFRTCKKRCAHLQKISS